MHNFNETINRFNTNSAKYDGARERTHYNDLIPLSLGDSDFKCAKEFKDAFLDIVSFNLYGYTNLNKDFYSSIISWYKDRHNIELNEDNILYTQSIALSLDICVRNLTLENDEIIINSPLFTPLCDAVLLNKRRILKSPLILKEDNRFYLDYAHIKSLISSKTKMIVCTNPHNPTTRVFTKDELISLYKICVEHEIILFVDEIYSDIIKKDIKFYSALNLESIENKYLIVASSPTKTFNLMGINMSYLIIKNKDIYNKILNYIDLLNLNNPHAFVNKAMYTAYMKCAYYVDELNAYIDANEIYFVKELESLFKDNIRIIKREGSFLLLVEFKENMEKFFLDKCHILLTSASSFDIEGNFFRINLATNRDNLKEVIKRIKLNLNSL